MHLSRQIHLLIVVLVLAVCFLGISASAAASPKRIGITKFDCDFTVRFHNGTYYDIGTGAADLLTTALFRNKSFQIIEREQLRSVLAEQGFGQTGAVDSRTAAEMGKLAGLDYVVYGRVISAGAENKGTAFGGLAIASRKVKTVIAVRMIDVKTGAIIMAEQAEGAVSLTSGAIAGIGGHVATESAEVYDKALGKAIDIVAKKINDLNPMEGCVAQVIGGQIYLDFGVDQGVAVGQKFRIYREGAPIINASGTVIGVAKTEVGVVKVVSVEGNMSVAQADKTDKIIVDIRAGDKAKAM